MAAPNLIGATTITGKTAGVNLTTTNATIVVSNAASSGKCLKVNTLNIANYGTVAVAVTVGYYNSYNTAGTLFPITSSISVPIGGTVTVIQKNTQYYLEENTCLGATAGTANAITITCSYEDIS